MYTVSHLSAGDGLVMVDPDPTSGVQSSLENAKHGHHGHTAEHDQRHLPAVCHTNTGRADKHGHVLQYDPQFFSTRLYKYNKLLHKMPLRVLKHSNKFIVLHNNSNYASHPRYIWIPM